jgi:hypothetical protein
MRLVHRRVPNEDERTKAARRRHEDKNIRPADFDYLRRELIDVGKKREDASVSNGRDSKREQTSSWFL